MKLLLFFSISVILVMMCYPIFSFVWSSLRSRPVKRNADYIRPVSIIIACFNEERNICARIDSFLASGEWIAGSEIIVVSTGSTDLTNRMLRIYSIHAGIRVVISNTRMSKIQGVNLAATMARHEILVFSDCRQSMKPGSVRELVANFSDDEVGAVAGLLQDASAVGHSSWQRSLLNKISRWDSQVDSCTNVYGALYAMRKELFRPIPEDVLFDDLFVVCSIISQHKRLVMEPRAVIYDTHFESYYKPERLRRLTRGLLLFLVRYPAVIFSMPVHIILRFFMVKYFKLLLPFIVICWIVIGVVEASRITVIYPTAVSLVAATLSLTLLNIRIRKLVSGIASILFHFAWASIAFLGARGRSVLWQPLSTDPPAAA